LELIMEPSMAERTTLGFGGRALAEAVIRDEAALDGLPAALSRLGGKPLALGRGSNLLVRDGMLDLALVRAAKADPPEILDERGGRARVRVCAGMALPRLLSWLAGQGLSGLEGLSGVPGSVGGAVAMNAGSYGREICDKLVSVRIFSLDRGMVELEREKISAGYRRFAPSVSGFWLVWEAVLLLDKSDPTRIKAEMRGAKLGAVGFSELHANFLVNYGGGESRDALEIMDRAERAVLEKFDVQLEREVVVL
jgi:UDP-N-acetylmuramate dehydrogenase